MRNAVEPTHASASTEPAPTGGTDGRLCWLVPVDEHAEERAALEFAKWLDRGNERHGFDAVYVPTAGGMPVEAVAERAKAAACEAGADELVDRFVKPDTLQLPSEALWEFDPASFTGVIIARRADADDDALLRLGGLTRHVALEATATVAVVPHDLEADRVGEGPVVLGVDPVHTPPQALRLANIIARGKGTSVVLVHVPTDPADADRTASAESVRRWAADAKARLGPAMPSQPGEPEIVVTHGEVGPALRDVARSRDASVIVVGTRRRHLLSRALRPSVALELSRFAERAVVMVPADQSSPQAVAGS